MNTDGIQILKEELEKALVQSGCLSFDSAVGTTAATTLQPFNLRRSLNTSAACGWAEYLVRRGTWPLCAVRSGCRVRRESRPSRDRSTARCRSRASRGPEPLLSH